MKGTGLSSVSKHAHAHARTHTHLTENRWGILRPCAHELSQTQKVYISFWICKFQTSWSSSVSWKSYPCWRGGHWGKEETPGGSWRKGAAPFLLWIWLVVNDQDAHSRCALALLLLTLRWHGALRSTPSWKKLRYSYTFSGGCIYLVILLLSNTVWAAQPSEENH